MKTIIKSPTKYYRLISLRTIIKSLSITIQEEDYKMLSEQHNNAVKDLTEDEVEIESIDFNNLKVTAKCSDLWEVVLTSVKGSTYKLSLNKVWNTLVAENY